MIKDAFNQIDTKAKNIINKNGAMTSQDKQTLAKEFINKLDYINNSLKK